MPHITFDHYVRYDELTSNLQAFASEFPNLVTLESIGKSYEGRDIWLVTITNQQTGHHSEKPAIWADANIHATEVSPTTALLYLIHKLTREYGKNADITRALDTRVFYICPRVNPDGAELALADKPRYIRSSTKWYPYPEADIEGFINEDMDGDGRLLMMRIKDPNGNWKQHPDEPRLLIRRDPTEIGGTYYRLMNEGYIENYDGVTIRMKRIPEGLDLNRNFPANWRQEVQQHGAGKYPTSEPEVRTLVDFIATHPNITNGITFHTWSGVLLRPYGTQSDDNFPVEDLRVYKQIGEKGTEITGYPAISVFHDFKYHPKEVITGVFDDWLYEHLGIFGWTVEIWSPQRQAGITDYKYIEWYLEHPHEDDLKMLKWSDEVLGGKGYVDWYPFNHPQLGEVELGGWDMMYAWRNPPPQFLEKE
ncbi:MAG: carboxypeptidase, partial [Phototrophicales bacterium]